MGLIGLDRVTQAVEPDLKIFLTRINTVILSKYMPISILDVQQFKLGLCPCMQSGQTKDRDHASQIGAKLRLE